MRPKTVSKNSSWCVVANIRMEIECGENGEDTSFGVPHFKGGAKVYIINYFTRDCDRITVIGQHRESNRYMKLVTGIRNIENLRKKVVYSPKILELIKKEHPKLNGYISKKFAEDMFKAIPAWQQKHYGL